MHTFFIKDIPEPGSISVLEKRENDHLFKTLRCRTGEHLRLCNGQGQYAEAEAMADRTLKILSRNCADPDPIRIHLFAALPKNSKLDSLLKPATEAGVASITPIKCRYSVAEKSTIPERWYTLLEEACKQSGNMFLPRINPAISIAEAIEYCRQQEFRIFFGAQHGRLLTVHDFPDVSEGCDLAWMVGPEGGFAPEELTMLGQTGCGITLGKHIFRLENAALAGIAFLHTTARAAKEFHQQEQS